MNLGILLTSLLLLPVIYCNKDQQDNHDKLRNKDWIQFLPSHVQHIINSKREATTESNDEISSSIQGSTESFAGQITNSSSTPEIMYGNSSSSSNGVPIGASIGSIILFFLICYCCFRCCCSSRETISQGVVIQPMQPPPPDPNQPNIVIQHIHATPHLQSVQPGMVQHVHHTHVPPPMSHHVTAPQFQQPPPYPPAGYETRQMLQQEWSPHAPMNQQQQQYPAPDYSYNPSAPPTYGKY